MTHALLTIAILMAAASNARPSQTTYPPLTRESLNGVWEGVFGIGAHPTIFHVVITPEAKDSYLSEFDPDSMKGGLFRMDSCTVTDGKVMLHFRSVWPVADGRGWWFEGEGCGNSRRAWQQRTLRDRFGQATAGAGDFLLGEGHLDTQSW